MQLLTCRSLRPLLAVAIFALVAGTASAQAGKPQEEKSLLGPDGTLYTVASGHAADLGVTDRNILAGDNIISWSLHRQDGSTEQGLVPDTVGQSLKRSLDLAYDEPSGSLVLLFKEDLTVLNILRLGIFKNGSWTMTNLLPNLGFAHAYNPQILLSHPTVTTTDANGNSVSQARTILSVIWWEEAQYSQARYAPIFLDEVTNASDVQVYDLPALVGNIGPTSTGTHPASAYMYPSLQIEGIGGAILASFTDLSSDKHYVIRITYPDNLGRPGPDNATWLRRRIPVVGIASEEGIPGDVPIILDSVKTVIGASYRPTVVWTTSAAVGYTRFDGRKWSPAITIPLTDSMTSERAMRLVQEMATRN